MRLFNDIQAQMLRRQPHIKAAVADLETKVEPMMEARHKLLESDLPALESGN